MNKHRLRVIFLLIVCFMIPLMSLHTVFAEEERSTPPEIQLTNLGVPIQKVSIARAELAKDANGRSVIYATLDGNPAKLLKVDVETEEVLAQIPIMDTVDGKEHIGEVMRGLTVTNDGNVYIAGSFTDHVFKYDDSTGELVSLGPAIPGQRTHDMDSSPDGLVFGGTYNEGRAYVLDTNTNEYTDLGRILEPEQYVYSLVYDEEKNDLYLGIGANAHIIKYDMDTGEKTEFLLPDEYQDYNFIFDLDLEDGKIFAVMSPSSTTLVLDRDTGELDYVIPKVLSRGVSELSPVEKKVYYTNGSILNYYDIDKKEHISLQLDIGGEDRGSGYVQLNEPDFLGETLVGITKEGRLYKYHLETGNLKVTPLEIEGEPAQLQSIGYGNDGRIHIGGYLGAGTAMYDPVTGETTEYTVQTVGVGQPIYQAESIIPFNDKIIYGGYTNTTIYEFDPNLPWQRQDSSSGANPLKLFDLRNHDQDRPFAMIGLEDRDELIIGTVPAYGELGGALTFYDFSSKKFEIHRNVVANQSIVSLTYQDGLIYGGTSIWGGLGIDPIEQEAKLFIWDKEQGDKILEIVPVPNKKAITAMMNGPDGNIWGLAEGTLFIFDPNTKEIIYSEDKFSRNYSNTVWRDAQMEVGQDGNIYGTISNKVFMIDSATKEAFILHEGSGVHRITQHRSGDFYFIDKDSLWKLEIINPSLEHVQLTVPNSHLKIGEIIEVSVTGTLTNGKEANLDGADFKYISSNPEVVSIENGRLIAHNVGTAEVQVEVTLNGNMVKSPLVEIEVLTDLETIDELLAEYRENGDLQNPLAVKLENASKQAAHHFEQGRKDQAMKQIENFLEHLNNEAMQKFIKEEAKQQLKVHAEGLLLLWGNSKGSN